MLDALEAQVVPPDMIVLRGPREAAGEWRRAIEQGFKPWRRIYVIPWTSAQTLPPWLPRLVPAAQTEGVTAWVCTGAQCSLPIRSLDDLQATLGKR